MLLLCLLVFTVRAKIGIGLQLKQNCCSDLRVVRKLHIFVHTFPDDACNS